MTPTQARALGYEIACQIRDMGLTGSLAYREAERIAKIRVARLTPDPRPRPGQINPFIQNYDPARKVADIAKYQLIEKMGI